MGNDIETGKSIGNRLRENETFLNDVLDCIQDGISILDKDLNILFVNKTMEKWYAHQMPLMGKKCYKAYHGSDTECDICPSLKTLKDGKPAMEIVPYTVEEGVKGWLELFTFPFKDSKTGLMKGVIEYVRDISERKRAEEAWRESEERFHKLSDASFEGIAIHDGETILAANKAFAEMLGYEHSDIAGESVGFVEPEYRDLLVKEEGPYEAVCLQRDGTPFICKIRGKSIPYQGRRVHVSAIRDITEMKQKEEALKKSELRYKSLFTEMLNGFAYHKIITDENGKPVDYVFLAINSAFEKLTGLKKGDIIGKKVTEVLPGIEKDQVDWIGTYGKVALTGEEARFESYAEPLDRWFNVYAYCPEKGYFSVIFEDITERKKADELLMVSEKKFRDLMETVPVGIVVTTPEGSVVEVNQHLLNMLGYDSKEEFQNLSAVVHYCDAEDRERFLESLDKNTGKGFEVRFRRKDGSRIWVVLHSISRNMAIETQLINVVTDITYSKQAEKKLRKFAEDLQLSNRKLEEFAAVASHDLQSPLISVLSTLKLLDIESKDKLDLEAEGYIGYARETIANMLAVIRSLLEYSRVGTSGNKFKPVDTEDALDQSIANLLANISETGARVTYDRLPHVSGDRGLLTLLFQNLIGNAIRFRGGSPSRIHISSERKGDEWQFSVSDNGIGIDPKDVEKIFEIFHSLKAKEEYRGTGIGLATCKKIVELHGGRIWVDSALGEGSTFHFTLPITEPDQPDNPDNPDKIDT